MPYNAVMEKRFLGIDFGTKRVGLAVSFHTLAEPLKILPKDENLFPELEKIIDEYKVDEIVVGVSENEMAKLSQQFASTLQEHFQLPIHLEDETLSSAEVHRSMREAQVKKRISRDHIDHFAAALILQRFLDEQ